jgi:iron(III) transport system substrate-binding protein
MKQLLAALLLGLATLALAQGDVVNVYSARHYESDTALYQAFTDATGIRVNVIEANADELIERIRSEGAQSPADVIITVDAGRLWRAEQAGLLDSVASEVLETAIPESLRHPEGRWFGLAKRARVIVYHKDRVSPEDLSTYQDLADPKWQGRICIRSSGNVYNQSLLAAMIAEDGAEAAEAWARGLAANLARNPQGGDTDQIKAVAAGECDVAVVNHYYLARLLADAASGTPQDPASADVAENIGLFFPNQDGRGTHVNITGAAVVAGAPNRENAIRLLEFLVTPEAQANFADGSFEYPVVAGASPNAVVAGFGEFLEDDLNVAALGENNPEAVRIADRAGWQ